MPFIQTYGVRETSFIEIKFNSLLKQVPRNDEKALKFFWNWWKNRTLDAFFFKKA